MFNEQDTKLINRMRPKLERVLVIDPAHAGGRMLADLMRGLASSVVWTAGDEGQGLAQAEKADPQLIFVELGSPLLNGITLVRHIRRSRLPCRQAPIIATTAQPTAEGIRAARDTGVHEFMCKPFNTRDLLRRLEAVTLRSRDWVEAVDYVGPDRRRFDSGNYSGPLKRGADVEATPDSARIHQALKIIKSAVPAIGRDPTQALRALTTQARMLQTSAIAVGDAKLVADATDFADYLKRVTTTGVFTMEGAAGVCAPLVARLDRAATSKTGIAA